MEKSKRVATHFDTEIFLYPNDMYYYRGTPYGSKSRIEKSLGIKKGAAQKDIIKAKKNLLDGMAGLGSPTGKNSFDFIANKYILYRKNEGSNNEGLSVSTVNESRTTMNKHLIPWFGKHRIDEIDQPLFLHYCAYITKQGLSLINHRKVLNHFLKWCVHNKYLKYRPEIQIPKSSKKKKRERVVLTDDEIRRMINAADGPILLYVSFYLLMGMRNLEICRLRWDEVDLENAALKINPMNNRIRKGRSIPINPIVLSLLKDKRRHTKGPWVFPSHVLKGQVPHITNGGFRKPWVRLLKDADINRKITPHDLRATFETHMHKNVHFTDTQREKMAGAAIDVQKNIYVNMVVEDLRGLENSVRVEGLDLLFKNKSGGKLGENGK